MSIWSRVDDLIDQAPQLSDLRCHRLHLFAARRWRRLGRPIPLELVMEERKAAMMTLAASALLERVRAACDGPMVLIKGPVAAASYPDPALRPFRDLDLLVPDAERVQRALLAKGFQPVGDPILYVDIHHLRPLLWPGLPLVVEVHQSPKWPNRIRAPSTDELVASGIPGPTGVDGVLALPPAHHALVLAAHSWAHVPLRRVLELVDIAAISAEASRGELATLARTWGLTRVWRTTLAATDALLFAGSTPWAMRIWARNLPRVRGRTVLESHLEHWSSPFWGLSPGEATRAMASTLLHELRPAPGESWNVKLLRTRRALRNAFVRKSEHDLELERRASTRAEA